MGSAGTVIIQAPRRIKRWEAVCRFAFALGHYGGRLVGIHGIEDHVQVVVSYASEDAASSASEAMAQEGARILDETGYLVVLSTIEEGR